MNKLYIKFFVLVFVCCSQVYAEEDIKKNALALAKSMMSGDAGMLGMKLSLEQGVKAGQIPRSIFKCVELVSADRLYEFHAGIISREMEQKEIVAATNFYLSEAGRKHTKTSFINFRLAVGLKEEWSYPVFTKDEQEMLVKFKKSSAGKKLLVKEILASKEANKQAQTIYKEIYEGCRP